MKISVVIPLYNKCDSVGRALQSVFAQTIRPLEIIIVNDGSTDGSEKLVEALHNPIIRLFKQPNAGVSAARNKGIEEAQGNWIAFLDADDEWKPTYLETMQKLALLYPHCSILGSAYEMQDHLDNRKSIILKKIPFTGEEGVLSNYFEIASCSHPPLCSSAVMVRKDAIRNIGGFPVGITSGEDLLTWARLAVRYEIAYNLVALSVFFLAKSHDITQKPIRLHDNQDFVGKELVNLYKSFNQPYIKKYIAHWYQMRTSVSIRLNQRRFILRYSLKSLRYDFLNGKIYLFILMIFLPKFVQNKIKQIYSS